MVGKMVGISSESAERLGGTFCILIVGIFEIWDWIDTKDTYGLVSFICTVLAFCFFCCFVCDGAWMERGARSEEEHKQWQCIKCTEEAHSGRWNAKKGTHTYELCRERYHKLTSIDCFTS